MLFGDADLDSELGVDDGLNCCNVKLLLLLFAFALLNMLLDVFKL